MIQLFIMAEDKTGFLLYTDQKSMVDELPDEVAGRLLKHIYAYVNDDNPNTDELIVKIAFEPIKQQLKRDLKRYEERKKLRTEAAFLGNLKRYHPEVYDKLQREEITPEEAEELAYSRKISHSEVEGSDSITKLPVDVDVDVDVITISFDSQFWEPYDKKRGRKKCLEKWKRLKPEDRTSIAEAVPKYVASTPEPRYRKDPLTYLNGEHWKDEIQIITQPIKAQVAC